VHVACMRNNRTAVTILVGNPEGNNLSEKPGPNIITAECYENEIRMAIYRNVCSRLEQIR
jgi:hypothetical protein